MNIYLVIVLLGFFLKLWVSLYALKRERVDHDSKLRSLIALTALLFVSLSVPQFFLLADGVWATPFGLPRYLLLRWYLFHGVLCICAGVYLMLCIFFTELMKSRLPQLVLCVICAVAIAAGAVHILLNNSFIPTDLVFKESLSIELGGDSQNSYLTFIRIAAVLFYTVMFLFFLKKYKLAKDHRSQIINLYALVALFLSVIEATCTVFFLHPILFSLKGVFFTVVGFLACSDRPVIDVRHAMLITSEAKTTRDMQRIFNTYAQNHIKHKEAMLELEKLLVSYKIDKVTDFRGLKGSPLPAVAESMDMKLSTLYDLLKRLKLQRP